MLNLERLREERQRHAAPGDADDRGVTERAGGGAGEFDRRLGPDEVQQHVGAVASGEVLDGSGRLIVGCDDMVGTDLRRQIQRLLPIVDGDHLGRRGRRRHELHRYLPRPPTPITTTVDVGAIFDHDRRIAW